MQSKTMTLFSKTSNIYVKKNFSEWLLFINLLVY